MSLHKLANGCLVGDTTKTPVYVLREIRELLREPKRMKSLASLGISDCYKNYFVTSKNAPKDAWHDPFPARKNWNPKKHADGLKTDWPTDRISFVNGPYFKNQAVTRKCKEQQLRGVEIVQLDKLVSAGTQYAEQLHTTGVEYIIMTCSIAFQGHSGQVANFKSKLIHYTEFEPHSANQSG